MAADTTATTIPKAHKWRPAADRDGAEAEHAPIRDGPDEDDHRQREPVGRKDTSRPSQEVTAHGRLRLGAEHPAHERPVEQVATDEEEDRDAHVELRELV